MKNFILSHIFRQKQITRPIFLEVSLWKMSNLKNQQFLGNAICKNSEKSLDKIK